MCLEERVLWVSGKGEEVPDIGVAGWAFLGLLYRDFEYWGNEFNPSFQLERS
jgi:hypothetical protein